jgi:hypothetical protein
VGFRVRCELRHQQLDLSNALVHRSRENGCMVLLRQVWLEPKHTGQVDLPTLDHLEDRWKLPGRACDGDATSSDRFRHVKAALAEVEHRRMPERRPKLTPIDLVDQSEELRVLLAVPFHGVTEALEEVVIAQCGKVVHGGADGDCERRLTSGECWTRFMTNS